METGCKSCLYQIAMRRCDEGKNVMKASILLSENDVTLTLS